MLLALQLNNLLQAGGGAPILLGDIPNPSAGLDTSTHQYELGDYFSGATSYSIAPAVEVGWTFNTTTGQLEIDTDVEGAFGPYVITATNASGNTDSNAFSVIVFAAGDKRTVSMGISVGLSLR